MNRVEKKLPGGNKIVFHFYDVDDIRYERALLYESIELYAKQLLLSSRLHNVPKFQFCVVITASLSLSYTAEELKQAIEECTDDSVPQVFYAAITFSKPQEAMTKAQYFQKIKDNISLFENAGFLNTTPMREGAQDISFAPLVYKNDASEQLLDFSKLEMICKDYINKGKWDPDTPSTFIDKWDEYFSKE